MSTVPEISNTVDSDTNQHHTVTKHRGRFEPAREEGVYHGVVKGVTGKWSGPKEEALRPAILSQSLCFYLGHTAVVFTLSTWAPHLQSPSLLLLTTLIMSACTPVYTVPF